MMKMIVMIRNLCEKKNIHRAPATSKDDEPKPAMMTKYAMLASAASASSAGVYFGS